jgi:hypothetical protein
MGCGSFLRSPQTKSQFKKKRKGPSAKDENPTDCLGSDASGQVRFDEALGGF